MNLLRFLKLKDNKQHKKKKLKQQIEIIQNGAQVTVSGVFNKDNYHTNELWLISRDGKRSIKVSETSPTNNFEYIYNMEELVDNLPKYNGDTYNYYFKVRTPFSQLSKAKKKDESNLKIVEENDELYAEYFIRCGRFQYTNIQGLEYVYKDNQSLINYITTKGNFSLILNGEPQSPTKLQIDTFKRKNKVFRIQGKIFTRNSMVNSGEIILKGRNNSNEISLNKVIFNKLDDAIKRKFGLIRYLYNVELNMKHLNMIEFPGEDIYDLFLKLDLHDKHDPKYVRLGRPTLRARLSLKDIYVQNGTSSLVINPYYTFKMKNLSFEVYEYPVTTFKYLRRIMRWAWLIRLLSKKSDTWIIGERVYKAQDTGLAFFKYMRQNHPEKNVFYVIRKDSPERENAEKYGNVLEYKSKEHILQTIKAKKVISSHHPDYLYPLRTETFKNKVKADKVFLQHGVMGTKNMVANYGKKAPGFDTDFFMVSSDFEKEMIVNDFGYSPKNVFVTGLSRFDTLFEKDVEEKRQLLIIPTWRDWITNDEVFFESEYYQRYLSLINNESLISLSDDLNFSIIFCLHPNMQKYSKHFENDRVKIINQGDVDVQYLIKQSKLMITDYSSVGFDFSFLRKPIMYYQFDRNRFIGKKGSHIDLDNDLPGVICFEEEQVIESVEKYARNNFLMDQKYRERSSKFIKHRDRSASERIFNVINKNKAKNKFFWQTPKVKLLTQGIFNKYRKSTYYFPSMKLFYRIGSRIIPVDKKLILFESGLGKQYGDSPKEIYENIVEKGLDYKKVWVYNKNFRFVDDNTKRIKRLSPQYYYYLLRSAYWVNNQNFPTYLRKRPNTTYLQTWHGTPLKKMLYDIEKIQGRSDDYVERVGKAVSNWDYLVSPSEYATKAFRSAFKYNGNVLEVGYPRNDVFYKEQTEDVVNRLKNKLKLNDGKKVILYAPTFRDDQTTKNSKFVFNVNMDLYKMKEMLGEEYVLLLRMHVVISDKLKIDDSLKDFVKNVSSFPDIQELLLMSDILITDYSSVMFDFANTKKPMLFYTYDLENYRDRVRGFYMDFEEEAPGPLLSTTKDIIENVVNIEKVNIEYKEKYENFRTRFCAKEDGMATDRVVSTVFENK